MTFTANIIEGIGTWSGISVYADDANPAGNLLHLEQFTSSLLDISTASLGSVTATAMEAEGEAFFKLEVYNRGGQNLTIRVTGGDTFELPAGQTARITYQRTTPTVLEIP